MTNTFFRRTTATLLSLVLCVPFFSTPALADSAPAYRSTLTDTSTLNSASLIRSSLVNTSTAQNATVMVYMIGSDLESQSGLATKDLQEMLSAQYGDNVNVIVQTMGASKWQTDGISEKHSQRFSLSNGTLTLVDDSLGQLDSTAPETLTDFVQFCDTNYHADRNILILWDHGSGPVAGFGSDDYFKGSSLTLDELRSALLASGVHFDMLGIDACLMGTIETCYALSSCVDYLTASEDFEGADGWAYQEWLTALGQNIHISTPELGNIITRTFVAESESTNSDGVLATIDLCYAEAVFSAWTNFALNHDNALTSTNYGWKTTPTDRALLDTPRDNSSNDKTSSMDDYFVTDVMAVANTVDKDNAKELSQLLSKALCAYGATKNKSYMTGLAVTLPYNSSSFYANCMNVFLNCGISETYLDFLGMFADNLTPDQEPLPYSTELDNWKETWTGWDSFSHDGQEVEFGTWSLTNNSTLAYYVLSNGDITYQDAKTHNCYYYVVQNQTWWQWHLRSWSWTLCDDPGYPTDLKNPTQVTAN